MLDVRGDLWRLPASVRVITTNGDVNRRGLAVMGRGCAAQAAAFDPTLSFDFARLLGEGGNHVMLLRHRRPKAALFSFPVKHHWNENADPALIARSACELLARMDDWDDHLPDGSVLIPRPGCGNGGLRWSTVRPILAEILDHRFAAVTF